MRLYLKLLSHLIFFGFLTMSTSCSDEEPEPNVDDELLGYINSFIEEGKKRGVDLSIQGLEAKLVTEFSSDRPDWSCGFGVYINDEEQLMEILLGEDCWDNRTTIEKENFIYHELGHALLRREHLNQTLPNQASQKSIMCSRVCSNFVVFSEAGPLREYYLDELFDENFSFPSSIANKEFKEVVYEEEFLENSGDYIIIDFDGSLHSDNFQIQWDSTELESKTIYGLGINSTKSERDSVVVFRSFDLLDFVSYSNLKVKAKFVAEDFDGEIDLRITLQDDVANATFNGISYAQRTFENLEINNELEVELYCIPEDTDWVTVSFFINSHDATKILLDNVEVELLE